MLEIMAYICKWDHYTELKNYRLAYSVKQKLRNLRSGEKICFLTQKTIKEMRKTHIFGQERLKGIRCL